MSYLRREDLYWTVPLLLLFGILVRLSEIPAWFMVELSSGEQASHGLHLERLSGVEFECEALGGKKMRVFARRGLPEVKGLGLLAIAGQWQGLKFEGITVQLPLEALRLEATTLEVNADSLIFSGGVRLSTNTGQGILYCSKLSFSMREDFMKSEGISIIAPQGAKGARGGKAVSAIEGTLNTIVELARR